MTLLKTALCGCSPIPMSLKVKPTQAKWGLRSNKPTQNFYCICCSVGLDPALVNTLKVVNLNYCTSLKFCSCPVRLKSNSFHFVETVGATGGKEEVYNF